MKLKIELLKVQEIIFKVLKKDPMEIRIKRYRLQGAVIGDRVRAFSSISSSEPYLIEIQDNVTVSTNVKFITHDNAAIKVFQRGTDLVGRIKIGRNCFIGANSIILPGVHLADNIIVGAGSVVTKSFLEEGVIIGGNPARKISTIDAYKQRYQENVFNFGVGSLRVSSEDKKRMILKDTDKLLLR